MVDRSFQHEGIIDRNVRHTLYTVPAWVSTARNGRVHHVVGHEEVGLQQLHAPAQHSSLHILFLTKLALAVRAQQDFYRVDHRQAAVQLSAWCVVFKVALVPVHGLLRHILRLEELQKLFNNLRKHTLKALALDKLLVHGRHAVRWEEASRCLGRACPLDCAT